jgi:hypothetical protein
LKRRPSRRLRFTAGSALAFPVLAVFLIPVLAAAALAAWPLLKRVPMASPQAWPFLAGVIAYVLFQSLCSKPLGLYVFGHELTHALAAWLSGYHVKSMKVSAKGGEVVTSDTNLFVALAPYCVPLYTVGIVLLYALVRAHGGPSVPPAWCGFGVGFTLTFHAALTAHALRQRQPDLDHGGAFLSWVVILLSNALALVLLLKLLFPQAVSLKDFAAGWWSASRTWTVEAVDGGRWAARWVSEAKR